MPAPILVNPIPTQVINEQAAFGPFDLKQFVQTPEGSAPAHFSAQLANGQGLPQGMICTADGFLTGIPAKNTHGNYEVNVTAENDEGVIQTTFTMSIKPSHVTAGADYADQIKAQVWQALEQNLPIPDFADLAQQAITPLEIHYLLEKWAFLIIWDAFNLEPPGNKQLLNLAGASPHYNVYDRGSCIVATPKDLFSQERTIEDALQTSRAMANEVYKRNWTIEMAGFEKMTRAAWVQIQHLGDQHGRYLEVLNFHPTANDVKLYSTQAIEMGMKSGRE